MKKGKGNREVRSHRKHLDVDCDDQNECAEAEKTMENHLQIQRIARQEQEIQERERHQHR
jgi:hypothetical protein